MAGADDFVDAIVSQGRQEPCDVAVLLRDRMTLPELTDLGVLVRIEPAPEKLPHVTHR